MILYSQLGTDKRLRDIVFAGSHDAGITTGGDNAQTQNKNIYNQALSGVRIFDLRVMAGTIGSGANKQARLMAYHSGGGIKKETKQRVMEGTGRQETIVRSKLRVGNFGLGLKAMLLDAARFVEIYNTEFLIMKFDKCTNWGLIADFCVEFLGNRIYKGTGDLNRKTLQDLAGKVVVVFSDSGVQAVRGNHPLGGGVLGWRNLYDKDGGPKAYDARFHGLQYFGKGGTSVNPVTMKWSKKGKIAENKTKQGKLVSEMASINGAMPHSSNVLGMMYWTSTGLLENIQSRNDLMWATNGKAKLRELWDGGLKESIQVRVAAKRIKTTAYASGTQLKAFMPNIVMIDFADEDKCKTIYDLNALAATRLTQMFRQSEQDN